MREKWTPSLFEGFYNAEHDACGIVSAIEKKRIPTKANIDACIDALVKMNHRAGFINGEGDGVGVHIDIPRALWQEKLTKAGLDSSLALRDDFVVGHLFIHKTHDITAVTTQLQQTFAERNFQVIFTSLNETNRDALGPLALQEEPYFWQIALLPDNPQDLSQRLFDLLIDIEQDELIHIASLSQYHAVYKVLGAGDILPKFYNDLANPLVASTMTLGHNRYSTNTLSNFFRVQPFGVLGHNGEINTIAKLREEAIMLGVPLTHGGSDSQDVSRLMETLISRHGLSLFEALDIVFPPIINEMKSYPEHLRNMYTALREAWGHFAQGPAGIISRYDDEAAFSLDSLGLRPLWKIEISDRLLFASEPGIVPSSEYTAEPKMLAPGEKLGLKWGADNAIQLYDYKQYQEEVYARYTKRLDFTPFAHRLTPPTYDKHVLFSHQGKVTTSQYAAFGWDREHIQLLEQMAEKGAEPIRSLGHDAPLAALSSERKNIADFIKESVAVVTNPAIDRDRETEHFSTRVVLGQRPSLFTNNDTQLVVELLTPILLEGKLGNDASDALQQPALDQLIQAYQAEKLAHFLDSTARESETIAAALQRLSDEAVLAVENGKTLLILDDAKAHQDDHLWIDPLLVTASVDKALVAANVRRHASLIVRSGAIRSLHDFILTYGVGADAISPYLLFETVNDGTTTPAEKLYSALSKGLEKVISTIGIHELRGYSRLFSSIGLHDEIASVLGIVNFFGGEQLNYNFTTLKEDAIARRADLNDEKAKPSKSFHVFPRIWKAIGEVAQTGDYTNYREKLDEIEADSPTTIRHMTALKQAAQPTDATKVDISVGEHDLPFVIASMSFGSQNEVAFRAYAEAANRLNMISLNGEGGEIKDMLGKYPRTRGQQVASGRFGVNAELLNSSNLLEIKIGQGAKPGEGGHLPASKVTAKIAEARNATIGSDLISPSNNHDIYSIEDLAQMVAELKTANDKARVSVKVPVVPNIGTIAVGVAKSGADIITISGFDGGTGAARIHALQNVGLPVEIGVKAAHNALVEAGLRDQVEIWADGGIKSAQDVMKVMLLGANRVGFGTLSMIAIGCTTCRGCHLDTCHVGIATQIESEAQAKEHGLRRFVPRQSDLAVQGLLNLFGAFGSELKALTAALGVERLQNIVGRSDLLQQTRGHDQLNLSRLLKPLEISHLRPLEVGVAKPASESHAIAVGAEYLDYDTNTLQQSREFSTVTNEQRVLGSRVSCHRVRGRLDGSYRKLPGITLRFKDGSIPGNGLGAYNAAGIDIHVDGGAQDGSGKTAFGGSLLIFKAKGKDGNYYNGSVGKGFGYGAQKGLLVAQGNADARAGIRLSGADMIIGGEVTTPVNPNEQSNIAVHANIKGFAFEYMTNGRSLVLGDPGPWICAGMTGGVVYLRHDEALGLTRDALQRRIAKGANVQLTALTAKGIADVTELLTKYVALLREHHQAEEAARHEALLTDVAAHFMQIVPKGAQVDPSVATE